MKDWSLQVAGGTAPNHLYAVQEKARGSECFRGGEEPAYCRQDRSCALAGFSKEKLILAKAAELFPRPRRPTSRLSALHRPNLKMPSKSLPQRCRIECRRRTGKTTNLRRRLFRHLPPSLLRLSSEPAHSRPSSILVRQAECILCIAARASATSLAFQLFADSGEGVERFSGPPLTVKHLRCRFAAASPGDNLPLYDLL